MSKATTTTRVGVILGGLGRIARDRAAINTAWEQLNQHAADERLSAGQMAWIFRQEPPDIDDDDVEPLVLTLWAIALRRYARDPGGVSADADALRSWTCRCGPGFGWIYSTPAIGTDGISRVFAQPCQDCNALQRVLWLDHWRTGCTCNECSGARRKHNDVAKANGESTDAAKQAELEGLT